MDKVLSIVIPSYNTEKYIVDCTATMLAESILDDIEILVVNDGSKDNTAQLADELVSKYPDTVRHINKENGGHGSTINRGILEAKGKYLRVIDGDDWVDTEALVDYVNKLKECDEDVILTPYNRVYEKDNSKILVGFDFPVGQYDFDEVVGKMAQSFQLHSTTFKVELLRKMRKIREHSFYVDQEYVAYPMKFIKTVRVLDNCIYQYRLGINEQSMSAASMIRNRAMHKNVIWDLIAYINEEEMTDGLKRHLLERVSMMARKQISIYLSMEDKAEAKKECLEFWSELREHSETVYFKVPGKRSAIFRANPKMAFEVFYGRSE